MTFRVWRINQREDYMEMCFKEIKLIQRLNKKMLFKKLKDKITQWCKLLNSVQISY